MIRIGLSQRDKQQVVKKYIEWQKINKIYVFCHESNQLKLDVDIPIEYYGYKDIIEYKPFYHLLEVIDNNSLLVFNECMRTQNRSDLTYNCAHHYCNQTRHKIVFEHFPIIDTKDDFMILLDLINKGRYKGKSFDYIFLQQEDIKIKPHNVRMDLLPVEVTDVEKARYEAKKEDLFNKLGSKDPDTIPRNLQLLAGDYKRKAIKPDQLYVARNKRFNLDNVFSYDGITGKGQYIIIDAHYRRLNMNDFLKTTGMSALKYLCTPLSIDTVIINEFSKWKARLDAIYAQSNIYK